jgi:hypothetical protein
MIVQLIIKYRSVLMAGGGCRFILLHSL